MIAEVKYLSYEFGLQLKQCEIVSLLTPPGAPHSNGVSERRYRTLLDMVRSMMLWHPGSERPVYHALPAQRPCLLATHNI